MTRSNDAPCLLWFVGLWRVEPSGNGTCLWDTGYYLVRAPSPAVLSMREYLWRKFQGKFYIRPIDRVLLLVVNVRWTNLSFPLFPAPPAGCVSSDAWPDAFEGALEVNLETRWMSCGFYIFHIHANSSPVIKFFGWDSGKLSKSTTPMCSHLGPFSNQRLRRNQVILRQYGALYNVLTRLMLQIPSVSVGI